MALMAWRNSGNHNNLKESNPLDGREKGEGAVAESTRWETKGLVLMSGNKVAGTMLPPKD